MFVHTTLNSGIREMKCLYVLLSISSSPQFSLSLSLAKQNDFNNNTRKRQQRQNEKKSFVLYDDDFSTSCLSCITIWNIQCVETESEERMNGEREREKDINRKTKKHPEKS